MKAKVLISVVLFGLALTGCQGVKKEAQDKVNQQIADSQEKAVALAEEKVNKELEKAAKEATEKAKEAKDKAVGVGLEKFAKCLKEKGAKMYGADWCGHCKKQKKMFGDAVKEIDYINCEEKSSECQQAGIKGYPTWVFADGSSQAGVNSLSDLAKRTGCGLPVEMTGPRN